MLMPLLCLLVGARAGVEGLTCSAPRALLPQRWAGATEALPRVLLPRGGGRVGTIVSAASDDTTPSLPLEEQASRTKEMLEAEDYAGAAIESAAALEVLPDLADLARMRGRALLDPLLDKMLEGAVLDKSEFGEAYEAFRLAAVMDPENGEEARMELVRIEELQAEPLSVLHARSIALSVYCSAGPAPADTTNQPRWRQYPTTATSQPHILDPGGH